MKIWLAEDLGTGDITTKLLVPEGCRARGALVAKGHLVLAGVELFAEVFRLLDTSVDVQLSRRDGVELSPGDIAGWITGLVRPLLTGERVALNLLQRLSGTATLTRQYVRAVAGTGACIVDTRKTIPGLRDLENNYPLPYVFDVVCLPKLAVESPGSPNVKTETSSDGLTGSFSAVERNCMLDDAFEYIARHSCAHQ